jgi:hypothetical protein
MKASRNRVDGEMTRLFLGVLSEVILEESTTMLGILSDFLKLFRVLFLCIIGAQGDLGGEST